MTAQIVGYVVTLLAAFGAAWLGARWQRKWTPDPIPSIKELGSRITQLQREMQDIERERVDAEQFTLSIELRQGREGNYIVNVGNDYDKDVVVNSVQILRGDALLSAPSAPGPNDDWRIPSHSGKPLHFSPQPDPTRTLSMSEPNLQGYSAQIRILVSCQYEGKRRLAGRTIYVTLSFLNYTMTQTVP